MTKKYDESSDPLSDLPQHPRGVIGAMLANQLLAAGWQETPYRGIVGGLWMPPGNTFDDGILYTLEGAYEVAFGQRL